MLKGREFGDHSHVSHELSLIQSCSATALRLHVKSLAKASANGDKKTPGFLCLVMNSFVLQNANLVNDESLLTKIYQRNNVIHDNNPVL